MNEEINTLKAEYATVQGRDLSSRVVAEHEMFDDDFLDLFPRLKEDTAVMRTWDLAIARTTDELDIAR